PGRFFTDASLEPYTIALDSFEVTYEEANITALGLPLDFRANVTGTVRGEAPQTATIRVNDPLTLGGTQIFLLGNGYAPVVTVRDPEGTTVFSQAVAFLPQDANLTSLGIIKIPDGLDEQVGMRGFLYPSAVPLASGALTSNYPDLLNPTVTMEVYVGDLGLDLGQASNAYALNTSKLTQVAGRESDEPTLIMTPGVTLQLPNDLGSIEVESIPRFASLEVHRDPSQVWVLIFAILVVAGLVTSLFIPRRRMWVKAIASNDGVILEYAGLARGDDPTLAAAVGDLADRHSEQLKA
ncbi:MAG: cytochrome c biogenesis protein ResB, partial [Rhodoglobus sp.]|nr:cytochrome c biogenesis protein ResB [Rhodoglobus sp.]